MTDKSMKRRELILSGNLWKAVIVLAIPAAINDFIRAMYNLIDTLFVSTIGSMEVAAITFVGPINMLVRTISMGLSVAGTNLIAREIGRNDIEKAKGVSKQLLLIAAFFGTLITVFSLMFSEEILLSASATPSIMESANLYFRLTVLSSPFVFINSIYVSIKRAEGDTLKAMNVNLVAMGIKIIITYVLIIHLGFGISGLAISTIAGTMFVTVYGLYDLFFKPGLLQLHFTKFQNFKIDKKFVIGLMIIAIPVIIEKSSISFGFIVVNKYVIEHGEIVLASYGITNRVNSMFFSAVSGFASGLSPIISQNLGAGQVDRARSAITKSFTIAIGISIVIISAFLPFRSEIASIFAKGDLDIVYHTVNAMGAYSITVVPWAVIQVTNGVFQGTGHTKYNMYISLLRIYLFRLPLVIIFTNYTSLAEYSVWYGMLISNILTGILAFSLYWYHRKDLKLSGE